MTPEHWRAIEELFNKVAGWPPEEQAAELANVEPGIRYEVEKLLASDGLSIPGVAKAVEEAAFGVAEVLDDATSASTRMILTTGARLGPYEILGSLGEGGMGQVFRAVDTRLGRQVAIKTCTEQFGDRFEREARAISALNHPHICTLYDIGADYLVMELVEGETLSGRLTKGPLSADQILRYGVETADALAAAHSRGIIHRDLKPGNIMLTRNGVKVLDFGLAKFAGSADAASQKEQTLTGKQTILGTPAYMAPEQALGQELDARADLFSLGVVMYEMATGKRPFQGDTSMATIDAILHNAPVPPSQFNPSISAGLEQVIEKALEKDRDMRYQTASGILADLKRLLRDTDRDSDSRRLATAVLPVSASSRWRRYVLAAAILTAALAGGLWWVQGMFSNRTASPAPLRRLTSDTGLTTDSAISPDGKLVAYASDRAGHDDLDIWVQQVDGGSPLRLTSDPANESEPSFSPDGNQIVFRSEREGGGIYTIPTLGGESRLIAKGGRNARFSPDGTQIAYVTGIGGPGGVAGAELFVVPAVGGTPQRLVPKDTGAAYPVWSPDSKSILFAVGAYRIEDWGIVSAVPEQASSPIRLSLSELRKAGLADLTPGAWDANNRILFSAKSGDSSHVFEVALSPPSVLSKQWRLGSSPSRLTSGTEQDEKPSLATAAGGARRLAFTSLVRSENLWSLSVDPNQPRTGGKIQRLTEAAGAFHIFPDISRDGTNVVYISHPAYKDQVWFLDLKNGKRFELPSPAAAKVLFQSHIFADGSRVYYGDGGNVGGIYVVSTSGGAPEKLCGGDGWIWDWSFEHRRILHYHTRPGSSSVVVGMLNLDTCQDSVFLERADSNLYDVRWSPDGRWVAFVANKGAHRQTYVVPFTGEQGPNDREWIPITDGSTWDGKLRWSPDGNWLYALSNRDGFPCIWAYRLDPRSKKPAGPPVAVFHSHGARLSLNNANMVSFAVSVARDKIVFNQGEITGNIWLTTLPEN